MIFFVKLLLTIVNRPRIGNTVFKSLARAGNKILVDKEVDLVEFAAQPEALFWRAHLVGMNPWLYQEVGVVRHSQ